MAVDKFPVEGSHIMMFARSIAGRIIRFAMTQITQRQRKQAGLLRPDVCSIVCSI